MTTMQNDVTAPADTLARLQDLLPAITGRAAEIESTRTVPADLLEELVSLGCFRVLLPASHGGSGADLPAAMRIVETLAGADASVGWTVMIGAATWIDLAGLPKATFDGLYSEGPDVMIAGAFSPSGVAVPVDGGYRVSGRWAFASGSPHSQWLYGNCLEESEQGPRLRIALFTRDEAELEDTWDAVGLRGTGSHHFHVDNVVVAKDRTWALMEDEPSMDEPILRIPPPAIFSLAIASAALGIAGGAMADIGDLAGVKVPLLAGAPLAANTTFQREFATADTQLRAARALVYETAERAWATATERAEFTLEQRAHIRACAAWAVETAAEVVTTAYRAAGGSGVYSSSPLQRRFRDIHAVTQHFLVRPDTLTTAGAALAGQEIGVPVF